VPHHTHTTSFNHVALVAHVAIKLDFKDPDAVEPSLILLAASLHWRSASGPASLEEEVDINDDDNNDDGNVDEDKGTRVASTPPVWLNADILVGPGRKPTRFDPERFIRQCAVARPHDTLSLGWTVERGELAEVR
jgi:hypothetical protein